MTLTLAYKDFGLYEPHSESTYNKLSGIAESSLWVQVADKHDWPFNLQSEIKPR